MKAQQKREWLSQAIPLETPGETKPEDPSAEAGQHAPLAGREQEASEPWRPGIWDALVGYWGDTDPEHPVAPEPQGRWSLEEEDFSAERSRWLLEGDDFSAEHGYEPDFEGRNEFEHGEFERWV